MTTPPKLTFARRPSALACMLRGAAPSRRRAREVPPLSASWRGIRIDQRELTHFLRLTQLTGGRTLPLIYPLVFGFRLPMVILTHPSFPAPIWRVLQTRNHVLQHHPIPTNATIDLTTHVSTARPLDKGLEIDLHTTLHTQGSLAWESLVTFLARGHGSGGSLPSPLAKSPAVPSATAAEWQIPDGGHLRFGRLTGDYNGIHLSHPYARAFGFRRALYHPGRVLGQILARLSEPSSVLDGKAAQRLDVWLKAPVSHSARVRLHADSTRTEVTFALFAQSERPNVIGRLQRVFLGTRLVDANGAPAFVQTSDHPHEPHGDSAT